MVEIKEVGESSRPSDENEANMNEEIVEQSNGEVWDNVNYSKFIVLDWRNIIQAANRSDLTLLISLDLKIQLFLSAYFMQNFVNPSKVWTS